MASSILLITYAILLIFQILHIFEEIGMEVYKLKAIGSLSKYLRVASIIMGVYIIAYLFLALELRIGIWLGLICSGVGIGNFLIHTICYLKLRKFRGTIAAGVFSSIPLGITGGFTFILLIQMIL